MHDKKPRGRPETGNKEVRLFLPPDVLEELDRCKKGTKSKLVATAIRKFCGLPTPKSPTSKG